MYVLPAVGTPLDQVHQSRSIRSSPCCGRQKELNAGCSMLNAPDLGGGEGWAKRVGRRCSGESRQRISLEILGGWRVKGFWDPADRLDPNPFPWAAQSSFRMPSSAQQCATDLSRSFGAADYLR